MKYKRLFSFIFCIFLVSCASSSTIPEDKYYTLNISSGRSISGSEIMICVSRFKADVLFRERPVVYSYNKRPNELLQYNYHHWSSPLPSMIQNRLIDYLRETYINSQVTDEAYYGKPDYFISGRIKRFVYVINGKKARVDVALEFQIQDKRTGQPLFLKNYKESIEIQRESVNDGAEGFSIAVSKIFNNFVNDTVNIFS